MGRVPSNSSIASCGAVSCLINTLADGAEGLCYYSNDVCMWSAGTKSGSTHVLTPDLTTSTGESTIVHTMLMVKRGSPN